MKEEKINLSFVVDNSYINQFWVTVKSITDNTKSKLDIYVICKDEATKSKLAEYKYHNCDVEIFYLLPSIQYNTDKDLFYFSGNLKYFIISLIPVDKIIYLDCDLILVNDIKLLWDRLIENTSIMAVWNPFHDKDNELLDITKDTKTFNSGVMLMNLKKMRENNSFIKLINFTNENLHTIRNNDQTAFNYVFKNDWVQLPIEFNFQTIFLRRRPVKFDISNKEFNYIIRNLVIVHFSGRDKPWKYNTNHKYKNQYLKYYEECFGKMHFKDKTFVNKLAKMKNIIAQLYYKYN